MKKLILLAVVVFGFSAISFAQNHASTSSLPISIGVPTAVSPNLAVSHYAYMNLGTITNSATGGTVKLWPDGSLVTTNGVLTSTQTGVPATFKVENANIFPTVALTTTYFPLSGYGRFDIDVNRDILVEANGPAHQYLIKVGGTLTLDAGAHGVAQITGIEVTVNNQ